MKQQITSQPLTPRRNLIARVLHQLKHRLELSSIFSARTPAVDYKATRNPGVDSSIRAQHTLCEYHLLGKPIWTPRRYENLAAEGYQQNVIVYRCVNLIAKGVASVPWVLYHQQTPQPHNHPLLQLLNRPNTQHTLNSFIETVISHLLLAGNAYIEAITVGTNAIPLELHPLRPDRLKIIPATNPKAISYAYQVNHQERVISNKHPNFPAVLHLKHFHPLHDWYGLSPIEAAAQAIDQHNAVSAHNLALLQNGGRPSGALLIKNINTPNSWSLTEEQRVALREQIHQAYEGSTNAGRILVLEGDFEWQEMGLSPKDLDFGEGKNTSAREIAQAYGVPPMLVGVPGDATFANYREARLHLWEDTIIPLAESLIAQFNRWLCPQFGTDLRLDYDIESIPALAPKREAVWDKIANANFLSVNEKREALGYGPISSLNPQSLKE